MKQDNSVKACSDALKELIQVLQNSPEQVDLQTLSVQLSKVQHSLPAVAQAYGIDCPPSPSESAGSSVAAGIANLNKRFLNWVKKSGLDVPQSYRYTPLGSLSATFEGKADWAAWRIGSERVFEPTQILFGAGAEGYLVHNHSTRHRLHLALTQTFPTCSIVRWELDAVPGLFPAGAADTSVIKGFVLQINDLSEIERLPMP